jgi:hypothetical protein
MTYHNTVLCGNMNVMVNKQSGSWPSRISHCVLLHVIPDFRRITVPSPSEYGNEVKDTRILRKFENYSTKPSKPRRLETTARSLNNLKFRILVGTKNVTTYSEALAIRNSTRGTIEISFKIDGIETQFRSWYPATFSAWQGANCKAESGMFDNTYCCNQSGLYITNSQRVRSSSIQESATQHVNRIIYPRGLPARSIWSKC